MESREIIKDLIKEIRETRLKNEEEINRKIITSLEKELAEKTSIFRKKINSEITGSETTWSYKRGYFIVILDCYDRLLENKKDKTAQEIFDKYKSLIINYRCENETNSTTRGEYERLLNEILDLKKGIFCLKKSVENISELESRFQQLEEEIEIERQSHLEAMENSQKWHERDIEAKVEQKLKERLAQIEISSK